MSIYLAAHSSLAYLERPGALRRAAPVGSIADCECSLHVLMAREAALRTLGCGVAPAHVLIDSRNKSRGSDWLACHLWAHAVPPGSFVSPSGGIYVSTPEFCLLQLAPTLSRIELIRLGYELCATYRLDPSDRRGFRERRALTTKEAILDYLDGAGDLPQARKVEDALTWVAEGSASPRETITSMLVSLPTEMGGRELGVPQLNWEIMPADGGFCPRRYIDLYWPEHKCGLEYDSDLEHSGADNLTHDSIREKEIELQGIRVARVTNAELKTEKGRDLLHRTLCQGLGKPYVSPSARGAYARRALASMLLAPHHTMI